MAAVLSAVILGWMHGWLGRRAVRYAVGRIIESDEAVLPKKMQNRVNLIEFLILVGCLYEPVEGRECDEDKLQILTSCALDL